MKAVISAIMLFTVFSACSHPSIDTLIGVEQISAAELKSRLGHHNPPQLLDVRDRKEYAGGHIPQSHWHPLGTLEQSIDSLGLNKRKPLAVICESGRRSALAGAIAKGHGFDKVYNLSGGILDWQAQGFSLSQTKAPKINSSPENTVPLTLFQQIIAVISGLVFKPTYMLLSLLLILFLYRSREKSRDMVLIRWGLVFFLAGESFCALNFLCTGGHNTILDIFHGAGMVLMGMLVGWGVFDMLDQRLLGISAADKACALRRFCGQCWKQQDVSCFAQRIFLFLTPTFALLSLMPLVSPLRSLYHMSLVFGDPVLYAYSIDLQLVDFRLYPGLAFILFIWALVNLKGGPKSLTKVQLPFFAGFGLMSFSLFRFFLLEAYRQLPIWSDFWEETTELISILGLGLLLIFYRSNFKKES
jgi:rhodanese-related sulfurtransferase